MSKYIPLATVCVMLIYVFFALLGIYGKEIAMTVSWQIILSQITRRIVYFCLGFLACGFLLRDAEQCVHLTSGGTCEQSHEDIPGVVDDISELWSE